MKPIDWNKKIEASKGLINLVIPFDSIIESSRNKIEKIGANSSLPGLTNQTEPKKLKTTGTKK